MADSVMESSLELPNGVNIPNRLVKVSPHRVVILPLSPCTPLIMLQVAMEEGIGYGGGLPGKRHRELYRRWGEGGWGVIISGGRDASSLAVPLAATYHSPPDMNQETCRSTRST